MVETEFAAVAAFGDAQTAAAKYREFRCLQVTPRARPRAGLPFLRPADASRA